MNNRLLASLNLTCFRDPHLFHVHTFHSPVYDFHPCLLEQPDTVPVIQRCLFEAQCLNLMAGVSAKLKSSEGRLRYFVLKDPRLCLTLPLWRKCLTRPKVVSCKFFPTFSVSLPLSSFHSLVVRARFSISVLHGNSYCFTSRPDVLFPLTYLDPNLPQPSRSRSLPLPEEANALLRALFTLMGALREVCPRSLGRSRVFRPFVPGTFRRNGYSCAGIAQIPSIGRHHTAS